ncbi:MAG TPA: Spy/CpxP family protein refolding chaperone [Methylovirgula sp.]|nr:Spy/CpxP family protein refolding chaperone [Methylovirgula sp.]
MGAVAGFHATRGFNNAGFARNAFGGRGAWRSWNRGWAYGGYGWNGYGWGGWYGPVFWPFFYGDLLSFALWPYDYYDPFWGYGPDFVLASVFWPGPYYDTDYLYGWDENPYAIYGYYGGRTHRGHHARAHEEARTSRTEYQAQAGETCAALAPGITDLPIERIERAIDPNDTQMAILKDLEAASAKANKILEASCPSEPPLTPVTRLDVMGDRIDAMIQAVQTLRAPLTTLDNSLDDKQRERFNAIAFGERRHRARTPSQDNGLAGLCADQSKDFANLPIDQIEQTVKPSGQEQVADFNALKNASAKAARSMDASCPTAMPQTLSDRFNAIVTRLDAMSGAVKTIEPALKTFYASLNDDQKARFNVMAPPNTEQQSEAQ